jgi:hypothetical protein
MQARGSQAASLCAFDHFSRFFNIKDLLYERTNVFTLRTHSFDLDERFDFLSDSYGPWIPPPTVAVLSKGTSVPSALNIPSLIDSLLWFGTGV